MREGILTSERVSLLSWPAEVFYRRLMSVVDDFGRYHAHPALLRAACYPLKLEKVSDSDIGKWIRETEEAGLVRVYPAADGKRYLEVLNFGEPRAKNSRFPGMQADASKCAQTQADADITPRIRSSYSSSDSDMSGASRADPNPPDGKASPPNPRAQAREVLEFLNAKAGRAFPMLDANLNLIAARLKDGATVMQCRQVIAKKAREWGGDEKMVEYLRPKTLFNATNFAQYVGELVVTPDG